MSSASSGNIFHQHLLPLQHAVPVLKISSQHVWASAILIFCFAIVVYLKVSASPKLIKIIQSTYNAQVQSQIEREEFNPFRTHTFLLNLLYLLTFAFFIYKINFYYKLVYVESSSFIQFIYFVLIILFIYSLKFFLNKVIAGITDDSKSIYEFENSSHIINYACGIFLLPWLVLSELSRFNPMVFLSGAIVVLFGAIIIKWYRGSIIGLVKQQIGLLQILVYFCILEILPIMVLVKYLIETF